MLDDLLTKFQNIFCLFCYFHSLICHTLGHRKDGTLFRLHNCLIGSFCCMDKCLGQCFYIDYIFSFDLFGKSTEQLG